MTTRFAYGCAALLVCLCLSGCSSEAASPALTLNTSPIDPYRSQADYPEYTLGLEGYLAASDLVVRGIPTAHPAQAGLDGPTTVDYDLEILETLKSNSQIKTASKRAQLTFSVFAHRKLGLVSADFDVEVGQEHLFFLRLDPLGDDKLYAYRGPFGRMPRNASVLFKHELFGSKAFDEAVFETRTIESSERKVEMPFRRIPTGMAKSRFGGAAVASRQELNDAGPLLGGAEGAVVLPSLRTGNWIPRDAIAIGAQTFYIFDWTNDGQNEGEVMFPIQTMPSGKANVFLFKRF